MNIEEICTLSDPLGGLAKSWMEEWGVAVLKPNAYNNVATEIWCVTDYELITDIKLLTDVDNKDERNHKENHLRYVSHNVTHSRRFTTYERTLAFLVNRSWPSQI